MLTYEKFVSGNSGSRYKYGEKFSFRHTIMALVKLFGVLAVILLLPLQFVKADHDCSSEITKFYLEQKTGRDISYVRHDRGGTCSVKFSDTAG